MVAFFEKSTVAIVLAVPAIGCCNRLGINGEVGIAPQLVKPYVKRGKNDAADAEALCEADEEPAEAIPHVKMGEQQAALMLVRRLARIARRRRWSGEAGALANGGT